MLDAFDHAVSAVILRAFAGSEGFDWAIRLLLDVDLLRFGPLVGLLVFAWVSPRGRIEAHPESMLRSLVGIVAATMVSRAVQHSLPERPRPRFAPDALPFPSLGHLPVLADWSSFPSDTAAFAFAIVTAIAVMSRPLAWMAAAWASLPVCFPRLYLGYHYLSDLAAGAVLGLGVMALVQWLPLLRWPADLARRLTERYPAAAVAALVLIGYELLTTFRTLRQARDALRDILHALSA